LKGLIIRRPWIDRILSGEKTWEMRSRKTLYRGLVGLIGQGTGMIVGVAELVDSLPPLDATTFAATRIKHTIPEDLDTEVFEAGWVYPWVFRDSCSLSRAVEAGQRPGQVIWVPLKHETIGAIHVVMEGGGESHFG